MKKESKIHINFVTNQLLKAMISLSKGSFVYEKNGESFMSTPLPTENINSVKKQIGEKLEKLCKNVIKIESGK